MREPRRRQGQAHRFLGELTERRLRQLCAHGISVRVAQGTCREIGRPQADWREQREEKSCSHTPSASLRPCRFAHHGTRARKRYTTH